MVYSRFLELPQLGSSHGLLQRTAALSAPGSGKNCSGLVSYSNRRSGEDGSITSPI